MKSIWSQYDHMISRNVLSKMGENASIIKTNYKYQAIATTLIATFFTVMLIHIKELSKQSQKVIEI